MNWRVWLPPRRWERDLDAELHFHLEQQIADYVNAGVGPDEARRRAYREFGAIELTKDECRDQRPLRWLDDAAADARYAVRSFARGPGFTIVAVLTLALGIGANSAMFTLVHRVLLKTLPVTEPERLVELGCINTNEPDKIGCRATYPGFQMYRADNQVLSGLFAFAPLGELNAVYQGNADLATGLLATGDMYSVLGVSPALGRLLDAGDDASSAPLVAILSHAYWQRRFGGDRHVIGRTLQLNTTTVEIVGVTPAAFRGVTLGAPPDITLPIGSAADVFYGWRSLENGGNQWLRMIGRRRDGVSLEQAQAGLEPIFPRTVAHLMSSLPAAVAPRVRDYFRGVRFQLQPASAGGASEFRRDLDRPLRILMGVAGVVLVIACANLATLLLSRTAARRRELLLRLAIGAGRGRLARQLLAEGLLLSVMGAVLGIIVAQWIGPAILSMASGDAGLQAIDLSPDVAVLVFTSSVALSAGIVLSLGPIVHLARADSQFTLRDTGAMRASSMLARLIAPAQVAMATIVLIGAGLLVQTFVNYLHVDLGFRSEQRITMSVNPGLVGYDAARTLTYLNDLATRLQALPGVRSVTFSSEPLGSLGSTTLVDAPGLEAASTMQRTTARSRVGARFMETAGLTLLGGRDFDASDAVSSRRIAIVNESFARHFFGTAHAIDRQFALVGQETPYVVVGVVQDALDRGPKRPVERVVYTLLAQEQASRASVLLRVQGTEAAFMGAIRAVLADIDASVPLVDGIRTVGARIDEALRRERLLALLATLFGGLALLLVAIGLYGLLAGAVARRTNEIGIRMALGARRSSVLWHFLGEGVRLTFFGLTAGLCAGAFLTRFLRSQLFGVTPGDPATFAAAAGVLIAVALTASLLPALRATRTDPIVALRHD